MNITPKSEPAVGSVKSLGCEDRFLTLGGIRLPVGWGPIWKELLVAIPLYVFIALVFTFPLVLNFDTYLIGDLESDMWKHVWGMWWTRLHLVELGTLPLNTHLLNAPYGGSLFFIDPLNALISVPLQFIWDMRIVYNLMVLFNLVLAAVGAYCLTRYLSSNKYAAFVGGVCYAFSAYMMAYINSGVTEAINIGWIPLFALFFIRMLQRNSWPDAIRAAVFFFCATIGSWYYGSFCVIWGTFYYIYFVLRYYRRELLAYWKKMRTSFAWPWNINIVTWLGFASASILYISYTRICLTPFASDWLTWSISLSGIGGILIFGMGLERDINLLKTLKLWGIWTVLAVAGYCDIDFLIGNLFIDGNSFVVNFISVQAVVILFIVVFARKLLSGQVNWEASTLKILSPLVWGFLIGLTFYCLFSVFGRTTGGDDIWGISICFLAFIATWWGMRRSLRHLETSAINCGFQIYSAILNRYYNYFWILAFLAIPMWRRMYPDISLGEYTYLFVTSFIAIIAWLTAVDIILRSIRERILGDCEAHSELKILKDIAKKWWKNAGIIIFKRIFLVPMIFAIVAGIFIYAPTHAFNKTINGEDSLVFRKRVANSVDIHLSRRFRNISNLCDYFFGSKSNTNRTYTVDKLTRVSYAGWVVLLLAGSSLIVTRRRQRNFWVIMVLTFMMFSLGPYLYITPDIYSQRESFIYMAFFNYFPSFAQIAIPYRFVAMVMLGLSVLASFTLAHLYRRWNLAQMRIFTVGLCAAILFDVAVFSPSPYPIPLSSSTMPAYCEDIARDTDDVGLIDYPIQRFKGELLPGEYFYYQMAHRKAIPNRVEGTIPLFVYQNAFTNYLFVLEHAQEDIPPQKRDVLQTGLEDLARFHFRYLVIHNNILRSSAKERLHNLLKYYLGDPVHYPQNIDVYKVPPLAELLERSKEQ